MMLEAKMLIPVRM